ncbi:MAG: hypothetical protein WCJ56_11050 [bacterium]
MICKFYASVAVLATLLPVLHAADVPTPAVADTPVATVAAPAPVPVVSDYVISTHHSGSSVNWITGQLEAVGVGYSVQRGQVGMIQARMAAVKIMTVEARTALAKIPVDGDATLDTAGKSKELQELAEATLTSLTIIDEKWDDHKGICTVVGVLPLWGGGGAIGLGAKLISPVITTPQPETLVLSRQYALGFSTFYNPAKPFTGVIIDADDVLLAPCLFPRAFRFDSVELLGPRQWNPDTAATGIVRYATNLKEATNAKRAGEHPLILKAQGTLKRVYPVLNLDDSWLLYHEWLKTDLAKTGPIIITLGKK